jgi:hypothetical protein
LDQVAKAGIEVIFATVVQNLKFQPLGGLAAEWIAAERLPSVFPGHS